MSKFYTSIEVRGNNILYRGYEDGHPVQRKIDYRPHVFLKTKEETPYRVFKSGIPVKKREFDSISEMKSFLDQFKEVDNFGVYGCSNIVRQFTGNMFREEIQWDYSLTKIWFFDIETRVDRLLVDPKTEVTVRHPSNPDVEKKVIAYDLLNMHTDWEVLGTNGRWGTTNSSGFVRGGFPDATQSREEVLMISLYDRFHKKLHLWSLIPASESNPIFTKFKDINFQYFEKESELLKSFLMFFANNRCDVLSGWNSDLFDIPFIVNRIKNVLGEELVKYLSPWRQVKQRQIRNEDGSVDLTYDIAGIVHLDYMQAYKKFNPGSKESFKLDFIAEYELGEKKVDVPGDSFREGYILYPETFVEYSAVDSMLLNKLEDKLLQVRLAMQLAYLAKCQITDVMSSMRLWESIIYNYFLDINVVEEWDKEKNEKHKIIGAYVHEPVPGKYGWTVSLDFASLYPSIIMQHNISPETIVGIDDTITIDEVISGNHINKVPDGCIISANGLITRKDVQGFIPLLVGRMFDLRKTTKRKMLDLKKIEQELIAKEKTSPSEELRAEILKINSEISALDVAQLAFKISANAFYGIMSLSHFKYYDYRMGEATTSNGQVFIKSSRSYLNDMLTKIVGVEYNYGIYSDTDSVVGDTLVYANGKKITIAELYDMCEDSFVKHDDIDKSFVKPVTNVTSLAFDVASEQIVNKPIKYVMKHKVQKRMFKLIVNGKSVTVTEDHSMIVYRDGNYVEVSPKHLKSGDKLLYITTQQPVSLYEETTTNSKTKSC